MSNVIGVVKLLTLVFISITGFVVLGGHTRVANPGANFNNAFEKLEGGTTPYGVTNALYSIVYTYGGYTQAFNMVNEVKVSCTGRRVSVLISAPLGLRSARVSHADTFAFPRTLSSRFGGMDSYLS